MRVMLVQQGISEALDPYQIDEDMEEKENKTLLEKAHSAIILSLEDNALREVAKEKAAASIWTKLESLYMQKSLHNRLFMK